MISLLDAKIAAEPALTKFKVYIYNIPANEVDAQQNMALLGDVSTRESLSGNSAPVAYTRRIQIQLFYSQALDFSPEDCEATLIDTMRAAGWRLVEWGAHMLDPDTNQLFCTITFQYLNLRG